MAKKKKNLYPKAPKKTGLRAWLRRRKLRTRRSLAVDVALMIFLGAFGLFSLFPLIYTVVSAFKPMSEIFIFPPKLTVDNPTLDNFFDLSFILEGFDVPLSWVPCTPIWLTRPVASRRPPPASSPAVP